jgi:ATP-dependent DNA helicase RecQ
VQRRLSQPTLRRIAEARPGSLSDMDRVADLGSARLERFGPAFLQVIAADGH